MDFMEPFNIFVRENKNKGLSKNALLSCRHRRETLHISLEIKCGGRR